MIKIISFPTFLVLHHSMKGISSYLKRFFIKSSTPLSRFKPNHSLTLSGKDLSHFKASRVSKGQTIELFDQHGSIRTAKIESFGQNSIAFSLLQTQSTLIKRPIVSLAVGMPKGNRSDWMVEKVTEVGISAIIPLETDRSVLVSSDPKTERWQRLIQQASSQSLTQTPPVLRDRIIMEDLLENNLKEYDLVLWGCMPNDPNYNPKWISEVEISNKHPMLTKCDGIQEENVGNNGNTSQSLSNILLIIGPEGDLSSQEKKKIFDAGGIPVKLSMNRLRVETASIILSSSALELIERYHSNLRSNIQSSNNSQL